MKIVFVVSNYFPHLGGLELFVQGIAERLTKKGDKVFIITNRSSKLKEYETINDVNVFRLKGIKLFFNKLIYWPELFQTIKEINPNVIVGFGHGHFYCIQLVLISKKLKKPLFILTYGPLATHTLRPKTKQLLVKLYDILFTPYLFQNCYAVFYRTPNLRKWCIELKAKKCFLSTTGIEGFFFKFPKSKKGMKDKKRKTVGFVGTICKRKGVHTLIEAVPLVLKENPHTVFEFVGSENIETEKKFVKSIQRRISELNIKQNVKFLKPLKPTSDENRKKLVALFDGFDVFVLPSLFEGPSQAMLQAMARGKPIVVAKIPSLEALVDERNGFLVEWENHKELAEKINILLKKERLRRTIGSYNKKYVKRFSLDSLAMEMRERLGASIHDLLE